MMPGGAAAKLVIAMPQSSCVWLPCKRFNGNNPDWPPAAGGVEFGGFEWRRPQDLRPGNLVLLQPKKDVRVISQGFSTEEEIGMRKALAILATVATVGATAVSAPAEARGFGWGWGPGLGIGLAAGALVAGAAYGGYGPYGYGYGYGPRYYGYAPAYYGGYAGYGPGYGGYGPGYGYGGGYYGGGPYAYYRGPYYRHRYYRNW
jgi:hypothetical protein